MNTQVGVLKNDVMFVRIASYGNIHMVSLTLERFPKCKTFSLNKHRHILDCLWQEVTRSTPKGSCLL